MVLTPALARGLMPQVINNKKVFNVIWLVECSRGFDRCSLAFGNTFRAFYILFPLSWNGFRLSVKTFLPFDFIFPLSVIVFLLSD
jgi:hypothetical protein